jgi:hypothetical protein
MVPPARFELAAPGLGNGSDRDPSESWKNPDSSTSCKEKKK